MTGTPASSSREDGTGGRIRWEPTDFGGFTGYVGTHQSMAFRLCPVPAWTLQEGTWVLTFELPATPNKSRYADDPEELKAEAEDVLAGFVSALGAVFKDSSEEKDGPAKEAGQ